ncbi:MAG TPA: HAMP domain-containing sensor histidine kinase [Solirubrobacteraceae bacterium]|nr:HAMP domain-containing sensor histidine kinase [Solirubrobacteraceae bacterium]
MSLRIRLLTVVVALITAALGVAAAAIYAEQRSYLYRRLDQRVIGAAAPLSYQLGVDAGVLSRSVPATDRHGRPLPRAARPAALDDDFLPAGTYGVLVDAYGTVIRGPVRVEYGARDRAVPQLPTRIPVSSPRGGPALMTVGDVHHTGVSYRLAAVTLVEGKGTLIVAVPSRDVQSTLDRLVLWELVVTGALIVLLGGIGWISIRIALRPLDRMGEVAGAIADGDLSRRVSPATRRSEVGRLGLSLNKMLRRIEEAFSARAENDRRQRQFLSDASHELRTPLASIRGHTELFRMGATRDPEALARTMQRIESEAIRMTGMVENLLRLARLDEQPMTSRSPVALPELITAAVDDARARDPERTITTELEPVVVPADANGLRQVLANLLGNALTHTPPGSAIAVALRREGDEAVLTVRDHGPGLPEGAAERVFDRFWRGQAGRERGTGGSGLGLAIVREIVRAHQGTVSASDHPHGGAVFTVRLPAEPSPVRVAPAGARSPAPAGTPSPAPADAPSSPRSPVA